MLIAVITRIADLNNFIWIWLAHVISNILEFNAYYNAVTSTNESTVACTQISYSCHLIFMIKFDAFWYTWLNLVKSRLWIMELVLLCWSDSSWKLRISSIFLMKRKKKLWQQPDNHEGFGQLFVVSDEQKLDWSPFLSISGNMNSLINSLKSSGLSLF